MYHQNNNVYMHGMPLPPGGAGMMGYYQQYQPPPHHPFQVYYPPPLPNALPGNFNAPTPAKVIEEDPVQTWCKKVEAKQVKKIPVTTTVYEVKNAIHRIQSHLQELVQYQSKLTTAASHKDNSQLNEIISQAHQLMDVINNEMEQISNEDTIEMMKKKVNKSMKKKDWRRRWRTRNKLKAQQRLANIVKQEKKATEWLDEKLTQQRRILQEEKMKNQADEILHEVRSKQDDTSKALELLSAISKLRNIRKTAAENTGVYPIPTVTENEKFERLQDDLEKMLCTQMENYKEEQKVLEVIIGNETAAQKEREALQCKYHSIILKTLKTCVILWEPVQNCPTNLSMYQSFWLQAEHSIEALVEVRRQWDSYTTPSATAGSSRLPTSNVIEPVVPSRDEWKVYLQNT
ncbi:Programmed cell death protein 7 [Trichoplax sp. H2]|nr:Programmed cell death protein 7 [Trichoplax sp. H2]|eukprot:RDD43730.1 Programmed cell death protein 7 [Trichoplax sp. H2]